MHWLFLAGIASVGFELQMEGFGAVFARPSSKNHKLGGLGGTMEVSLDPPVWSESLWSSVCGRAGGAQVLTEKFQP